MSRCSETKQAGMTGQVMRSHMKRSAGQIDGSRSSSRIQQTPGARAMCITSSRLAITHFITHIGSSLLWKSVELRRHQLLFNQQLTHPQ